MKYYSAIRKDKIMKFDAMWVEHEVHANMKSIKKRGTHTVFSLIDGI